MSNTSNNGAATSLPQQAAAVIRQKTDLVPQILLSLGSGSVSLANQLTDAVSIPYTELPGFAAGHVEGHKNELRIGKLNGMVVACLMGRTHYYEGNVGETIKNRLRTLRLCGCETLLMTNASGSLRETVGPGSLVAITDHINFQFNSPLAGTNDDEFGPRFFPLDNAYDADLREQLKAVAAKENVALEEGVYCGTLGPSFETHAEIRAYRTLGADLVGMSTVPEALVARHCGMKVLAVAIVTNFAAGMTEEQPAHELTLKVAGEASEKLTHLLDRFIAELAATMSEPTEA